MTVSREDLGSLIDRGLVSDVLRMERSFALLETIGTRAELLNAHEFGNFGELFGALQEALQTECLMAASRIFDPPGRRYPNRGMRHVLSFIRDHADELPAIAHPQGLKTCLAGTPLELTLMPLVDRGGRDFAIALVDQFSALIVADDRTNAIDALRTIRDKAIAHNEQVETVEGPTWQAIADLIAIAKKLVAALGWAYANTAYEIDGDFLLTSDAQRPGRALERLVERLRAGAA
mgnify:CR=1 FL=1